MALPDIELLQTAGIVLLFVLAAFLSNKLVPRSVWILAVNAFGCGAAVAMAFTRLIAILDSNTVNRLSVPRAIYCGIGFFVMIVGLATIGPAVDGLIAGDRTKFVPAWAGTLLIMTLTAIQVSNYLSDMAGMADVKVPFKK